MDCLTPRLEDNPDGQWHCPVCPPLPVEPTSPTPIDDPRTSLEPDIQIDPALQQTEIDPALVAEQEVEPELELEPEPEVEVEVEEQAMDDVPTPQPKRYKGKGKAREGGVGVFFVLLNVGSTPSEIIKVRSLGTLL